MLNSLTTFTPQPLGPITITLYYNGTWNLLPDASPINTVTVRSITVLVVDTITDNPIAGGGFNVTGSLVSDNGSAVITHDGTPMLPTLTFDIDGFTSIHRKQWRLLKATVLGGPG